MPIAIPPRLPRRYVAETFQFQVWEDIEPLVLELVERPIGNADELHRWMLDCDELDRIIGEESRRRRISVTQNTADQAAAERFNSYITDILPRLNPLSHQIQQKLYSNPYLAELDEQQYFIHLRYLKSSIELYRDENVLLAAQLGVKEKQHRIIVGGLSVWIEGKELTLQQAAQFLRSSDRTQRETAFRVMNDCWLTVSDPLNTLYDELCGLRQQIAQNAGFGNYRDFKFAAMGRYDYTPADCLAFHDTIETEILPLVRQIQQRHRDTLGISPYRPWDTDAELPNQKNLRPFETTDELTEKSIQCLERVSPDFADNLRIMREMGNLDLGSRKNKAPGGYNSSLPESGVPFIFMNAVGTERDVKVMLHESGHAMHTFSSRHLELTTFKNMPSEIAELASMAMELMSMEHWDIFYDNEADLRRAKIEQLENVLSLLPWVAVIDGFQHWVYTHPQHTHAEREQAWAALLNRFSTGLTDWTGLEQYRRNSWHKQLHVFEVPFYYIEYAMAQLGAIAVWQQYRQNPEQALANYKNMLCLGYSRPLPELYGAAGIRFDFSRDYVRQLADFIRAELEALSTPPLVG